VFTADTDLQGKNQRKGGFQCFNQSRQIGSVREKIKKERLLLDGWNY
jgi:hypothetical protein